MTVESQPQGSGATRMTGAQAIVRCLEDERIEYVFGMAGHANLSFLDALRESTIRFISVPHEQIAVHMADAYYRVTHRPAVVLTSVGPGFTNTVTGIADAMHDCSAVILISGNVPIAHRGTEAYQEIAFHQDASQADVLKPIVKRAFRVDDRRLVGEIMARAFSTALGGVPGPVLIDVPKDIVDPTNPRSAMEWYWPTDEEVAAGLPGYRYHLVQVAGFAGEPARGNAEGPVLAPLADEIARYVADRGLERPAIVGHSMGGTLAMMVAARHPSRVGRVMVVDMLPQPAGLFGGTASSPLAEGLRNWISTPGGRRLFGALMGAFSPPDAASRRSDPDVVARATHELSALDLTPQLARIGAPLTILYAAPRAEARAAVDRQFASAYAAARQARLVRIDDSGHMVMLDQPRRFQTALREFLGG